MFREIVFSGIFMAIILTIQVIEPNQAFSVDNLDLPSNGSFQYNFMIEEDGQRKHVFISQVDGKREVNVINEPSFRRKRQSTGPSGPQNKNSSSSDGGNNQIKMNRYICKCRMVPNFDHSHAGTVLDHNHHNHTGNSSSGYSTGGTSFGSSGNGSVSTTNFI